MTMVLKLTKGLGLLALIAVPTSYMVHHLMIPTPVIHGETSLEFRPVAHLMKQLVQKGSELGSSLAVYHKDQLVVNLISGYSDIDVRRPWTFDTVTFAMSITKGVGALCMAFLYDRGAFSYDDPVSKYWPQFAANGKQSITIGQLLSHRAGLLTLDRPITVQEIIKNEPIVAETLAKQKPTNVDDGKPVYHALTFGLYVDQLIMRIDSKKRRLSTFLVEEIARPYGIDISLGINKHQFHRLARLKESFLFGIPYNLMTFDYCKLKMYFNLMISRVARETMLGVMTWPSPGFPYVMNQPDLAAAPIGCTHLVTNAYNLARLFSVLTNNGSLDDAAVMKSSTVNKLLSYVVSTPSDYIFSNAFNWSYGLTVRDMPLGSKAIGHLGYGGQMVWSDRDTGITIAYMTNQLHPESPGRDTIHSQIIDAVYQVVETQRVKGNQLFI